MRMIPSAAAITQMEECIDWLLLVDPEDARIVWLRAEGVLKKCKKPDDVLFINAAEHFANPCSGPSPICCPARWAVLAGFSRRCCMGAAWSVAVQRAG